jgi:hypothetical protein
MGRIAGSKIKTIKPMKRTGGAKGSKNVKATTSAGHVGAAKQRNLTNQVSSSAAGQVAALAAVRRTGAAAPRTLNLVNPANPIASINALTGATPVKGSKSD